MKEKGPPAARVPACDAELIIASSETDANMRYATGFAAPDPFIYFKTARGSAVLVSDLEYGRALKQAGVQRVLSVSGTDRALNRRKKRPAGEEPPEPVEVLGRLLKKERVRSILVPENFPVRYADLLRKQFLVRVKREPFFEQRAVKNEREIQNIRSSLRTVEEGFSAALQLIREAAIGEGGILHHGGRILRAETVRRVINTTIASRGYTVGHTIVACGDQGVNPHNEGSGPLKAHKTIIIDIFPRSDRTGYFGDFTRTVVKGRAPDRVREAYQRVREAQEIAFSMIADGVDGRTVHEAVCAHFSRNGFANREGKRGLEGFFHGTGHGIGLEVHEYPRIGKVSNILRAGNTVTVEPGLYYRGMGGIRLEDVVVVLRHGCRNLTRFPKVLEIE